MKNDINANIKNIDPMKYISELEVISPPTIYITANIKEKEDIKNPSASLYI